jgi:hypothetical protein
VLNLAAAIGIYLVLSSIGNALASLMSGTSPSINENGDIAFQGSNGNLWNGDGVFAVGFPSFSDTNLGNEGGYQPEHQ